MSGVPLVPEGHHRISSRERTVPLNPNYAESQIASELADEADARELERRAQAQYVKDFIANAEANGYRVKLDKNLNVIKVERMPQSEHDPAFNMPQRLAPAAPPELGSSQ